MHHQENEQENTGQSTTSGDDSKEVNIKPSEPETGAGAQNEKNAPGRTPGKAEGSVEIFEADLADKENQ